MSTAIPARPGRSRARTAIQLLGFCAGLGLLAWCVSVALRPENREQLSRLRHAETGDVAALLGLSALSLTLNGLAFWWSARPVRRLGVGGVLATNALATFLNYLPFKVGALVRVLIHHRRDRMPMALIGSWFAAVGVLLVAALGPLVGASLWRRPIDAVWFAAAGAGLAVAGIAVVVIARVFAGDVGRARIEAIASRTGSSLARRAVGTGVFRHLHAGLDILADPRAVAGTIALRVGDVAVQAARFLVVGRIIGEPITLANAALAASTFFVIGVVSPAGMLGAREGGTAALVAIPASATLLAGAGDLVVNLAGALIGLAWLKFGGRPRDQDPHPSPLPAGEGA